MSAVVMTLAAVAPLRLDLAIPLPTSDDDADAVVTLGLLSTIVVGLLGTAVIAVSGDDLARVLGHEDSLHWLWAAPAIAVVIGWTMVFGQLAVRNQRYRSIGRRNLISGLVLVVGQLGAGLAGLRPSGLLVGLALGQLTGAFTLARGSGYFKRFKFKDRVAGLRDVLARYRSFPMLLAPAGLINVLGLQLPAVIVAFFFGGQAAGWYGLAQRVVAAPVTLIGAAVAQVYLGELASTLRANGTRTRELFMATSRRLALIGVVQAFILLAFAPTLFSVVLGSEWRTSGEYARALAIGIALQLLAVPLSQTLVAFERQITQFLWDLGRLVLVAGSTAVAAAAGCSAATTMWVLGGSSAMAYGVAWVLSWRTVRCVSRPVVS